MFFIIGSCDTDEDKIDVATKTTVIEQYDNVGLINSIDTVISFSSSTYWYEDVTFNIDIDLNGTSDVSFIVGENPKYKDFQNMVSIQTFNDFSFAIEDTYNYKESNMNENGELVKDSELVEIPKVFQLGDTISDIYPYDTARTKLAYSQYWSYNNYKGKTMIEKWKEIGARYIGIRNSADGIFCWIKVEVLDYNKIRIQSFSYEKDEGFLIIKE